MRHILPKLLAIAAIFLLLLALLATITNLVHGRESYRAIAQRTITQGTAGAQSLIGPLVAQQCTERWTEADAENKTSAHERSFVQLASPTQLNLPAAQTQLTPLRKGLFSANTFTLKTTLEASFAADKEAPRPEHANGVIKCQPPSLILAIGDARGIRSSRISVNQQVLTTEPGTGIAHADRGVHAALAPLQQPDGKLPALQVKVELELAGTSSLAVAPVGDETQVQLAGNWPHPAFGGRFLPVAREVTDKGFTATWRVSALATSAFDDFAAGARMCAPRDGEEDDMAASRHDEDTALAAPAARHTKQVSATQKSGCVDAFSVRFIDPVDPYTLSDRATKYGLLFVVLTFVAVGMVEILKQLRVHPVQYLLVGSALSIFFLLLLSLSEHLPFGTSYALAASACVALLTYYASHILRGWRRGLPFGAGIGMLYGLLFLLLQMEQNSLLAGSIALFAVLTLIMVVTRRIDWYALLGADNLRQRRTGTTRHRAQESSPPASASPTALWDDA